MGYICDVVFTAEFDYVRYENTWLEVHVDCVELLHVEIGGFLKQLVIIVQ